MAKKTIYIRRDDGTSMYMGGHGYVAPGTVLTSVHEYYLEGGFFEVVEVEARAEAASQPPAVEAVEVAPTPTPAAPQEPEMPWLGYDLLTAKRVIGFLEGMEAGALESLLDYEAAHSNRVTVQREAKALLKELGA